MKFCLEDPQVEEVQGRKIPQSDWRIILMRNFSWKLRGMIIFCSAFVWFFPPKYLADTEPPPPPRRCSVILGDFNFRLLSFLLPFPPFFSLNSFTKTFRHSL